jgi:hypothetical protein
VFEPSASIRPARESLPAFVAVAAIWSAVVWAFFHAHHVVWPAALNGALMVGLVVAAWRTQVAMRLYEQDGTVFYDRGFGAPRVIAAPGDGARIARVQRGFGGPVVSYVLDGAGRARLKLMEGQWDPAELRRLWDRVGVSAPDQPEVVTASQASKRYPDARPIALISWFGGPTGNHGAALEATEVRPSPERTSLAAHRIALVLVVAYLLATQSPFDRLTVVAMILAVIVLAAATSVMPSRTAILDDGKTLSHRDGLGRVCRVVARGEGGRVIRVRTRSVGLVRRPVDTTSWLQLWLDGSGRCRMVLPEARWNTDTLAALRDRVGLPLETLGDLPSAAEVNRRFPGAARTTNVQATGVGVAVVVGVIVVLLAYGRLVA